MIYMSNSAKQTQKIAESLAKTFSGGEIILLSGELGSGKTVFAKGIAAGLGVTDTVTSPTFTIMNLYRGERLNLCHCDAYRLQGGGESDGEISEYFGKSMYVSVVEWHQNFGELFKDMTTLSVIIEYLGNNQRKITIENCEGEGQC